MYTHYYATRDMPCSNFSSVCGVVVIHTHARSHTGRPEKLLKGAGDACE